MNPQFLKYASSLFDLFRELKVNNNTINICDVAKVSIWQTRHSPQFDFQRFEPYQQLQEK